MTYEEYKKKKKEEQSGNVSSGSQASSAAMSYDEYYKANNSGKVAQDIYNRVNEWLNSTNSYIASHNERYKNGNTAYRTDANDWYKQSVSNYQNTVSGANAIRADLEKWGGYLNKDWVNSVNEALEGNISAVMEIGGAAKDDLDFWSMFKDEDEYTAWTWSDDYKDYSYDDIKKEVTSLRKTDPKKADYLKSYAREKDYGSSEEYDAVIGDLDEDISTWKYSKDVIQKAISDYRSGKDVAIIRNRDDLRTSINRVQELDEWIKDAEKDRNSLNTNRRAKAKEEEIRAFTDPYTSAPDFEEKSVYSPTPNKTPEQLKAEGYKLNPGGDPQNPYDYFYLDAGRTIAGYSGAVGYTGEDDDFYTYINNPDLKNNIEHNKTNHAEGYHNEYYEAGYHLMEENEIKVYNYLYHEDKKNGTSKAEEYLNMLVPILKSRQMAEEGKELANEATNGFGAPVISSAYSVIANLQNSYMFLPKVMAAAMGEYDDMPWLNEYGNQSTAIRSGVGEELGYVGNLLYQGGMSIADMAVAMGVGAGMAGGTGAVASEASKKAMGRVTQAIMSSSAGSSAISEAKDSGASDGKALMLGLGSAAIEWATEKYSIENLLKNPSNLGTYFLKNIGAESAEESASNLLNIGLDQIVSEITKEKSSIMAEYDNLVLSGKSSSEAAKEVLLGKLKSLGEDAFVGALTGAGMSAVSLGSGYVNVKADEAAYKKEVNQKSGAAIIENKTVKELLSIADSMEDTKANKRIKSLAKDIADIDVSSLSEEQKKKYQRKVGKLQRIIMDVQGASLNNSARETVEGIIQEKLKANGVAEADIKKATDVIIKAFLEDRYGKPLTKAETDLIEKVGGNEIGNYLLKNRESWSKDVAAKQIQNLGALQYTSKLSTDKNIDTSKYTTSDDGKVYIEEDGDYKEVDITGVSTTKNGKIKVNLSNGKTADVLDLDISADDAIVFEGISQMGLDSHSASAVYDAFKVAEMENPNLDAKAFVIGAMDAVNYGKIGAKAYLKRSAFTSELSEKHQDQFYRIGELHREAAAKRNAESVSKAIKQNGVKGQIRGNVTFKGVDPSKLNARQKVTVNALSAAFGAMGINTEFFASPVNEKGEHIGKNGSYDPKTNTISLDIYAGVQGNDAILFTAAHELTHFIKEWSSEKFNIFADFLVENYAKHGVDIDVLVQDKIEKSKKSKTYKKPLAYDEAFEEVVCDSCETFLRDSNLMNKLVDLAKADLTLFDRCKLFIDNLLADLQKAYKGLTPDSEEARFVLTMKDCIEDLHAMWEDAALSARDNLQAAGGTKNKYLANRSIKMNDRYVEKHRQDLESNYNAKESKIELTELLARYDKVVEVWRELGGELDSKFLNEWNDKSKDKAFTVFKAQAGYKYNVELSSMCKKGVPLFEAIDQIVKKEVLKKLKTDTIGKAEKEILYDILKQHDFEIPCAICYVEQARQREGVIIDSFLNGKIEKNSKGKTTTFKLGWNEVLNMVSSEMKKMGADYTFPDVDRSIATEEYMTDDIRMDKDTEEAFREALKKIANEEIERYNRDEKKSRSLLKATTPAAVKECFKGTLPSNLKIFKVLFNNPKSRFMIGRDLLYSSMTTRNLAMSHNDLYSLFNSQGGVSGYKTKQGTVVYWGDILNKKWSPSTIRGEGGVRNQSNSDFQMYTLLDQVQMYVDFSAKGYYLQAYTKVLSELKLFGLSGGKINASLIPKVVEILDENNDVDYARTQENAGLDENGELLFDDFEGINHKEAFMLIADPEYSKNICGICIGYSDNHIRKMLDDDRIQLIIGFHDKTDDPNKRYRGARYAKNYNGLNEAQKLTKDGEWKTVHVAFNKYVAKAEKMFKKKGESFYGETEFNGKTYVADDIPRLAADMYLADYDIPGKSKPAYDEFKGHQNYYKLLADFGLYDSEGHYALHRKVVFNMPDTVPFLDADGNKAYMKSKDYMKAELEKELDVRDSISEALADESKNGIIPQFVERVNDLHQKTTIDERGVKNSDRDTAYMDAVNRGDMYAAQRMVEEAAKEAGYNSPLLYHGTQSFGFTKIETEGVEYGIEWSPFFATNKIDTAQTYSGATVTRNISEDYSVESVNDLVSSFVGVVNRTAGIYDFMPYDTNEFNDVIERVERGDIGERTIEKLNIVVDKIAYALYDNASYYDESLDEETFFDSDDMTNFYEAASKLWEGLKSISEKGDEESGNYQFYANTENFFEIDAKGSRWDRIPLDIGSESHLVNTRRVADYARSEGYQGVKIANLYDDGGRSEKSVSEPADVYIFFNPKEQVKSADPVTYDDNGDIIPLSKRFDSSNDDIRYSDRDSKGRKLSEWQAKYFKNSKVRDKRGRLIAALHGTKRGGFTEFAKTDEIGYFFARSISTASTYADGSKKVFAPSKDSGEFYGAGVYEVYLNIENPLVIEGAGANWNSLEATGDIAGVRIVSKRWNDREGLATIEVKRGKKTFKKTVTTADEFEGFLREYFGDMAKYIAMGMDGVVDENGKGKMEVTFPWDFDAMKKGEGKTTREIVRRAYDQGYDGVIFKNVVDSGDGSKIKADDLYVVFNSNQVKSTANKNPTYNQDIRYSDRDMEAAKYLSPRSLLANALESTIDTSSQEGQNELRKLTEYKERIRKIEELSKELSEVNGEIKNISFTKGKDRSKLVELNARKVALEDHINRVDKKLLQLEATKPMKDVLVRERKKGEKKLKEKYDALIKKQRKDRDDKLKAVYDRYAESRKKNVEGRRKTEIKHKIKRVCADLNKMLKAGRDKANVKEGLRSTVEQALASSELLFKSNITNMDIVRNGVSSASNRESMLLNEYTDLMAKREEYISKIGSVNASGGNTEGLYKMVDSIDRKIAKLNKDLSELFERERKRINEITVDFAIQALADAYHETNNSSEEYIRNAYSDYVYERIVASKDDLKGATVQDMTLEQLGIVYDNFKMVLHTIRAANSLFKMDKAIFVDQMAGEVIDQVKVVGKGKTIKPSKNADRLRQYGWNELKPRTAFERIGSRTLLDLYDQLRAGEDTFAVDVNEAFLFAEEQREITGYYDHDMLEKHSFSLMTGQTFNLNLSQMLSIYAYSKRDKAAAHMLDGGFIFDSKEFFTTSKKGVKKLHEGFEQYRVTPQDLAKIIAEIPQPLVDYVDAMQKYLSETMGEKGNETSMEVFGIKLFKEDFYFPLVSSKDFIKQNNEPVQAMSLVNAGMTKPTKPNADNPIVLTGFDNVWAGHVNKMSLYHSFVPQLENIRKVYNYYSKDRSAGYSSVKATIKTIFGEGAANYVDKFIDDVNGGMPSNEPGNPLMGLFGKFKKTAVGASLSTVVQQPTAIIRAMADIDPKYFANIEEFKKGAWEELKQYAPIAIIKEIGGFDTGSGRGVVDYLSGNATKNYLEIASEKVDDLSMLLAGKADEFGWNIIWGAVKKEIASTTDLKVGSEEFLQRCGERFTEVVHKTQVYDSVFTRSGFMRSKNDLTKISMSFMAEPTTAINMLYSAVMNAKRGNISAGKAARSCGAVFVSQILASFMASLIYGARDDDEDEAYVEKVLEQFGSQLLDDTILFIPKSLPYIKDIMTLFEGWDVERNDMSILTDIRDAFGALFSENKSTYRKIEDFAGAIAAAFGLPAKNVMREFRALYNFFKSIFDDITPTWDSVGSAYGQGIVDNGIVGGARETLDKAINAFGGGDDDSEDDRASANRKELRSKDKRIKEAASSVIGGDYASIEDYTDRIVAEGKYAKEDVVGAINAEVSYFKNKVKKAAEAKIDGDNSAYKDIVRDLRKEYRRYFTQDEIVSMISKKVKDIQSGADEEKEEGTSSSYYKPYMVNEALNNGDTAQAIEIIDDIIEDKVENGDTKKEAKASVRSSVTSYWKPLFLEAYKSKDNAEMTRIRKLLRASKLYDDPVGTTQDWIKSLKKK